MNKKGFMGYVGFELVLLFRECLGKWGMVEGIIGLGEQLVKGEYVGRYEVCLGDVSKCVQ